MKKNNYKKYIFLLKILIGQLSKKYVYVSKTAYLLTNSEKLIYHLWID